jgi:hypothetical protein
MAAGTSGYQTDSDQARSKRLGSAGSGARKPVLFVLRKKSAKTPGSGDGLYFPEQFRPGADQGLPIDAARQNTE